MLRGMGEALVHFTTVCMCVCVCRGGGGDCETNGPRGVEWSGTATVEACM
jgi:hypothetical protein